MSETFLWVFMCGLAAALYTQHLKIKAIQKTLLQKWGIECE